MTRGWAVAAVVFAAACVTLYLAVRDALAMGARATLDTMAEGDVPAARPGTVATLAPIYTGPVSPFSTAKLRDSGAALAAGITVIR